MSSSRVAPEGGEIHGGNNDRNSETPFVLASPTTKGQRVGTFFESCCSKTSFNIVGYACPLLLHGAVVVLCLLFYKESPSAFSFVATSSFVAKFPYLFGALDIIAAAAGTYASGGSKEKYPSSPNTSIRVASILFGYLFVVVSSVIFYATTKTSSNTGDIVCCSVVDAVSGCLFLFFAVRHNQGGRNSSSFFFGYNIMGGGTRGVHSESERTTHSAMNHATSRIRNNSVMLQSEMISSNSDGGGSSIAVSAVASTHHHHQCCGGLPSVASIPLLPPPPQHHPNHHQ